MFGKCTACLTLKDNVKILTENDSEGKQLILMYTSLINFEWITNENIIFYLCNDCEKLLEVSYNFRNMCLESYDQLVRQLENYTKFLNTVTVEQQHDGNEEEIMLDNNFTNEVIIELSSICDEATDNLIIKEIKSEGKEMEIEENGNEDEDTEKVTIEEIKSEGKESEVEDFGNEDVEANGRSKEVSVDEVEQAILIYKQKYEKTSYKCLVCSYISSTSEALSNHMIQMHKDMWHKWCYFCNEMVDDLPNHRKIHKSQIEICPFCNEKVTRRYYVEHLKIHSVAKAYRSVSEVHPENDGIPEKFLCYICATELKTQSSFNTHLKKHSDVYKCKYCDKRHKSKGHLVNHERTHTGEKPYICDICGKGFSQTGALTTHMKLHTGRPEECQFCKKRFCRPSELKLHLRRHLGEKPYSCTECGKSFIQGCHLLGHLKTHSDARPFKCDHCSKDFKLKSSLKGHLQIHLGYKPYECEFCEYSCLKRYRFQQHMKIHEDIEQKNGCTSQEVDNLLI